MLGGLLSPALGPHRIINALDDHEPAACSKTGQDPSKHWA